MPPRRTVDPRELVTAIAAVAPWLQGTADAPERADLAAAVRLSLRTLEQVAPGHTVEVRVPPFAAVQCIAGPRHTRGTPPNVVETDPRSWLELITGSLDWDTAVAAGRLTASGSRAGEVATLLPIVALRAL
ncbi:MAG: sterol carrier family protein [Actinomycetota bacterium]|nr:sterol carrier family protein [Actinomycetota bacterium]